MNDIFESEPMGGHGRIAYIKPTDAAEARAQGIIPRGVKVPDGVKLYVLHAVDGSVLTLWVDTLCIHGDTPGAATIASAVRQALAGAGIDVAAPARA